jgi:hypothetical protein
MKVVKTARKDKTGKRWGLFPVLYIVSLIFYLVVACENAAEPVVTVVTVGGDEDEDLPEGGQSEEEDIYDVAPQQPVSETSFVLDAVTGLPANVPEENSAGKVIATLTVPETEGPWTPELDAGVENNDLFEIELRGDEGIYEIRIASNGGPLPLGPYKAVLRVWNEAEKVYQLIIEFAVANTPPPFKDAPIVRTVITAPARNKLFVDRGALPTGAAGWRPYIGTSTDSAKAQPYGDVITAGNSVEITDIEGDGTDGGLSDGTIYYVWLRPWNNDGEGGFGTAARCKTSDPIDPYWWTDIDWWDSGSDSYEFYFNDKNELVLGYCTKGSQVAGGINGAGRWIVRHHISFDPGELNKKVPHTAYGHYTTNEDLTGSPGGVFIVETPRAENPFYAVYYWGHRTRQTAAETKKNPFTQVVSLHGTVHSYLSNAWNTRSGGGYSDTLEKAINGYGSISSFGFYVAFVAIPWYPVKDGRYKYGTAVQ